MSKLKNCIIHMRLSALPLVIIGILFPYTIANNFILDIPKFKLYTFGALIFAVGLGAANAFNSYYDKDKGSIAFLKHPPKVTVHLLYFSLFLYIAGLFLSYFINPRFFLSYLAFSVITTAYSHPGVRLKKYPLPNILANGIGVGLIAYGGWVLSGLLLNLIGLIICLIAMLDMVSNTLMHGVWHYDSDLKNGDKTLSVYLGKKKSVGLASIADIINYALFIFLSFKVYFSYILLFFLSLIFGVRLFLLLQVYKKITLIDAYNERMRKRLFIHGLIILLVIVYLSFFQAS